MFPEIDVISLKITELQNQIDKYDREITNIYFGYFSGFIAKYKNLLLLHGITKISARVFHSRNYVNLEINAEEIAEIFIRITLDFKRNSVYFEYDDPTLRILKQISCESDFMIYKSKEDLLSILDKLLLAMMI